MSLSLGLPHVLVLAGALFYGVLSSKSAPLPDTRRQVEQAASPLPPSSVVAWHGLRSPVSPDAGGAGDCQRKENR